MVPIYPEQYQQTTKYITEKQILEIIQASCFQRNFKATKHWVLLNLTQYLCVLIDKKYISSGQIGGIDHSFCHSAPQIPIDRMLRMYL